MTKRTLAALLLMWATLATAGKASAAADVVATIRPIHSLVAAVMQGAGTPHLLVDSGSPHSYSLKPSDASALQKAEVIFYVGPELETFLEQPLKTLGTEAHIMALAEAPGLRRLKRREGADWQRHEHAGEDEHGHADEHEDDTDPHIWLAPANALAMAKAIAAALTEADPANAAIYASNAEALERRLLGLQLELTIKLAPVKDRPFIVFHDAYQYLQAAFGLNGVGSVTVSPEKQPGARHIAELHDRITRLKVACVFAEPQFEPKLVATVTEGTGARTGTLDPVGAAIPPGPDLYFTLQRNNAEAFLACMK